MHELISNLPKANSLIEKQRISLVDSHKSGCPWRTRQCDGKPTSFPLQRSLQIQYFADSVYCISLQSPTATIRAITSNALTLDAVIKDVSIKHPLVSHCICLIPVLIMRLYADAIASQCPLFYRFVIHLIRLRDFVNGGR